MDFVDLRLAEPILRAVVAKGYTTATPIQAQTIPHVLAGRDLIGCAQTGTGKTAAFALPLLHHLASPPTPGSARRNPKTARALILAPTRELAGQIAESFKTYGQHLRVTGTVIYGGVGYGNQIRTLRQGVDVVVATPGRLIDLVNQSCCDLSGITHLVLDEADRMLDMGFLPDIKRIISALPRERQTLLFSATMPRAIRELAAALLRDPVEVTVAAESLAVERIEQAVYHVNKPQKPALLVHLMTELAVTRSIVFTRTKHGADRLAKHLVQNNHAAEAIHSNKSQNARSHTLDQFRAGKVNVLVATDIAARGIDVHGISHVFNFDIAREPESHIHRIGRTARAGAQGIAITFCDRAEVPHLRAVEHLIRMKLPVHHSALALPEPPVPAAPTHGAQSAGGSTHSPHPHHASRRQFGNAAHPRRAGKPQRTRRR
jgi:ATP-dependent RNA helicase RhlE